MHRKLLREAFLDFDEIKDLYDALDTELLNKKSIIQAIRCNSDFTVIEIGAAITIIENEYPPGFVGKADILISGHITNYALAITNNDDIVLNSIRFLLRKELEVSAPTINKYLTIALYQEAIRHHISEEISEPRAITDTQEPVVEVIDDERNTEGIGVPLDTHPGECCCGQYARTGVKCENHILSFDEKAERLKNELADGLDSSVCPLCKRSNETWLERMVGKIQKFFKKE